MLTIQSVLDQETGEEIHAQAFFQQDESAIFEMRYLLQDAINSRRPPKFTCYYCGQLIGIRGKPHQSEQERRKSLHFSHLRDSDDCPIKTGTGLTEEQVRCLKYNGAKESALHEHTKTKIAHYLWQNEQAQEGVTDIRVEKVIKDKSGQLTWRRPDISARYHDHNVVFEIQLSTTFLSVISDREHFYRQHQTFIIWVFKRFSSDSDLQRFTQKDIFYSNNRNAFVFDDAAMLASAEQKNLVLTCFYQEPYREQDHVQYRWVQKLVGLQDLTFDQESYKVYYFDVNRAADQLSVEIQQEQERRNQIQIAKEAESDYVAVYKAEEKVRFSNARFQLLEQMEQEGIDMHHESPLFDIMRDFSTSSYDNILQLYLAGYHWTEQENAFFQSVYAVELHSRRLLARADILTCVCLMIICEKLKEPHKVHRAAKIMGVIFKLLTIRIDRVVGQAFKQRVQVLNTMPEPYFHLMVKMLDQYQWKIVEQEDKKGKLRAKIEGAAQKGALPSHDYDDIFQLIFPQLF